MRLLFSNFLLSLVLGSCFMYIQAQDINQTETTTITLPDNETTLNAERTSEVISMNTVTKLMTATDVVSSEATQDYQMNTKMELSTDGTSVTETAFVTKPTTSTIVPDIPTTQKDNPTTALEIVTSPAVTESATSDSTPSTGWHKTTNADLSSSEHHQYETTTADVPMTTKALITTTATGSTEAFNPTTISNEATDTTEYLPITSQTVEITTHDVTSITSTTTLISTSQSLLHANKLPHTTTRDFLSTNSTSSTTGVIVGGSILPLQTNWFLIIIVCAVVICVLFASMLLFVQWRKKNTSGKFGPGYVNGQSKKSKKKKGAERDAWAGPVYLEAEEGVECEEIQGALMSGDGNRDGDDVVLSTFSALESEDTPNGAVGGEGTKEAKKWDEQEPLLYIDEEAKEDNMGQKGGSNDRQEVNEKVANGENMLNGGETFCITTAV